MCYLAALITLTLAIFPTTNIQSGIPDDSTPTTPTPRSIDTIQDLIDSDYHKLIVRPGSMFMNLITLNKGQCSGEAMKLRSRKAFLPLVSVDWY